MTFVNQYSPHSKHDLKRCVYLHKIAMGAIFLGVMMSRWKEKNVYSYGLPYEEGVYVFYGNGRPVYVGESVNLHKRATTHYKKISGDGYVLPYTTPWGTFSTMSIKYRLSKKLGESAMAERRLLKKLKGLANVMHVDGKKFKRAAPCLTDDVVILIRNMKKLGKRPYEIAEALGINANTVSKVVRRQTYKMVKEDK